MSLRLSAIPYGSLLSYSTKGFSAAIEHSKGVMATLKQDLLVEQPPIPMSQWIANKVYQNRSTLPFASFFNPNAVLVPVPSSSLMQKGTLWVPERLASALACLGLGRAVVSCLVRTEAVPKSAWSPPWARTTAPRHYQTLAVQGRLSQTDEVLLIDDIVTRGATLLGAANRLMDSFPNARIRAFAAMRAIGNPVEFVKEYDPQLGVITLRSSDGQTFRRP